MGSTVGLGLEAQHVAEARIIKDGDTKTKFANVAGCDGAKTELMEVPVGRTKEGWHPPYTWRDLLVD